MSLLKPDEFAFLFEPLQGKRIGFVQLPGNAGDNLIHAATIQLFRYFEIDVTQIYDHELESTELTNKIDEFVISGGANIGSLYPECAEIRNTILTHGLPTTIFPQSFTSDDEDITPYKQVYVREKTSLKINSSLTLAPDLALGYEDINDVMPPEFDTGVFLREDVERQLTDTGCSICDPAAVCWNPEDYLSLASQFAHIYTDRLHFAIAGLITGREVTLLPNTYYKNRAVFDTWLSDLGCRWSDNLAGIDCDSATLYEKLWPRLAGVPDWGVSWASVPYRKAGDTWAEENGSLQLNDSDGNMRLHGDEQTQLIWSLCDGQRDLYQVASLIGDAYPQQRVEIGRDVRNTIGQFNNSGMILLNRDDEEHRLPIRLTNLDSFNRDGWNYRQARIIYPDIPEKRLWFSVPEEYESWLDNRMDAFLIATLMDAMYRNRPLSVEGGEITDNLAKHLQAFQDVWDAWRKDYTAITLDVELVSDPEKTAGKPSLLAFSGGLDSAYSAWRMHEKTDPCHISALMVHGLDIPLTDQRGYRGAFLRAKDMLDSLDIELIPMRTNFRAVHSSKFWEYRHATALAGSLSLLSGKFGEGIISATLPDSMQSFWGSNPITDPLLGSTRFPINHFGDDATRLEKVQALSKSPEILKNLRVCWVGLERDRNCGQCLKCLMLRLSLLVSSLQQSCFDDNMDPYQILAGMPNKVMGRMDRNDLKEIIEAAICKFPGEKWVTDMRERYAYLYNIEKW